MSIAEQLTVHKSNQGLLKNDLADEYQDFNLVVAQANGRPSQGKQWRHQECARRHWPRSQQYGHRRIQPYL